MNNVRKTAFKSNRTDTPKKHQKSHEHDDCWIHIRDVYTFIHLGAHPSEQKIGHNLKFDLSIKIDYRNTNDNLENVVDYSELITHIQQCFKSFKKVTLIEYLAEQILDSIEKNFPGLKAARLCLHKNFLPMSNFTGTVTIEAQREFA
jgi:dihydroneopterin aldolase